MALDVLPSTWLGAGYTADSSAHTISFKTAEGTPATLPQLTDAEAATNADVRKIIFGLMDGLYAKWLVRVAAAAADPTGDPLPTKLTMYKSTSTDDSTGEVTRTYTVQCKTTVTGEEIAAEA